MHNSFVFVQWLHFILSPQNLFSLTCKTRSADIELNCLNKYTYLVTHSLYISSQTLNPVYMQIVVSIVLTCLIMQLNPLKTKLLCMGIRERLFCSNPNFEDLVFCFLHFFILYNPLPWSSNSDLQSQQYLQPQYMFVVVDISFQLSVSIFWLPSVI